MGRLKVEVDAARCKITSPLHGQHIRGMSLTSSQDGEKAERTSAQLRNKGSWHRSAHSRPAAHKRSFTKVEDRLNARTAAERKSQVSHEGLLGEEDVLIQTFLPQEQTAETYSCMSSIRPHLHGLYILWFDRGLHQQNLFLKLNLKILTINYRMPSIFFVYT